MVFYAKTTGLASIIEQARRGGQFSFNVNGLGDRGGGRKMLPPTST
jgi:hypothetical protein